MIISKHSALLVKMRLAAVIGVVAFASLAYYLRFDPAVPYGFRDSFGGFSYVLVWIVLCFILFPRTAAWRITLAVLAVTCLLEVLQLWHPPWLEQIRKTLAGRLLLGTTFEWSDFPPYFVGALGGWIAIKLLARKSQI